MTVRELLSDESKWCKRHFAEHPGGSSAMWSESDACAWCLHGAIALCYRGDRERYDSVILKCREMIPGENLWAWNDAPERTFADVKALLEELNI